MLRRPRQERALCERRRDADHAAIDRRRLFAGIHATPACAGAGDDRARARAFGVRDLKDRATPVSVPFIGPFFYDYTVFVGGENFTVTEPNDMVFLDYFTKRCIAADEEQPADTARNRGLIHRFFRWMAQPV
jgi:hypothetical protein